MAYEGPGVFLAPCSNEAAQENFSRTVLDGVPRSGVAPHTDSAPSGDPVRMWGTKDSVKSTWEKIGKGDFLLFYDDGTYTHAAAVRETEYDKQLGQKIWPNHEQGSPWACIIYLEEPVPVGVSSEEIADLAGYDIDHPLSFQPLNEMGIGGIRGRYGSVQELVYESQTRSRRLDTTARLNPTLSSEILDGLHFPVDYTRGAQDLLATIEEALGAGKHVIFTGPPGTGKTEIARRVSRYLAKEHADLFTGSETTTATADWSTFETVGGYMPEQDGTGQLEFTPGQVLRCFKGPGGQRNDLLVIDELNRSDIDKSFGQLFTLLSGQAVTLPFTIDGDSVEVRHPEEAEASGEGPQANEYIVPRSWRLLGTMNSYDKTSLYEMSYAFMRRFAFIHVGAPDVPDTDQVGGSLVEDYADAWGLDVDPDLAIDVAAVWRVMNDGAEERRVGPAIIEDVLTQTMSSDRGRRQALTDAVVGYVLPQLEGVRGREATVERLAALDALAAGSLETAAADLLGT